MLLLAHICWDSNVFAQCETNAIVVSIAPGYSKSGVVFNMEAGLWPVAGKLGILGGPIIYNEEMIDKGENAKVAQLDFTGRLIYKVTELGDNSPQIFTLFGTVRGTVGASNRCYFSLGRDDLLGLEPFYSNKTGMGINLLFTTKL